MRQIIDEWYSNMGFKFSPSWVSCLDKSMSKRVGKFTCPGFSYVPYKLWLLGNEYHTILHGRSGILYAMKMKLAPFGDLQRFMFLALASTFYRILLNFERRDGVKDEVCCLKDPEYVIMFMSSFRT